MNGNEMIYMIDFVDFWDGFNKENNYIINTLRKIYGEEKVMISGHPDYLFFSCFGFKNLKYRCIKIYFIGENIVPDFNLCDYAIGIHNIQFEDRYFRLPFYMLYPVACRKSLMRNRNNDNDSIKRKFCCYVISNSLGTQQRKEMIDLLSSYKEIDSGGKLNNNVGGPVKDKLEFLSRYKFSLCFENSSADGYTTEKIVEGFAGGGIPIYWGNPEIAQEFNSKAFINCNDFVSLNEALEYIKKLDKNDELYLQMLHEPIFLQEQDTYDVIQGKFEFFLQSIFNNGIKKINTIYVGKKYTDRMRFFAPLFSLYRLGERFIGFCVNRINIRGLRK